jgi:Na+/melibiose symporter-like transporter
MFLFFFIAYYATGVAGLLVVAVSTVITFSRIWDGITDPMIGYLIDKTRSKVGKFRPYMILGNIILAGTSAIMLFTTHLIPENFRLIYFILIYLLYIIGYTFQTACTKAAQTVLTNDPKQRPMFTLFDAIYNTILFIAGQAFVASVLVPRNDGFTLSFFREAWLIVFFMSGIFTILAVISIWNKDVEENWGIDKAVKLGVKDYLKIIKGNRPLQMLIISASTDKLANLTQRNAITIVIIYGILMGNYALSGSLMIITAIPTILITFLGINYAKKLGIKKAYVLATQLSLVLIGVLLAFMNIVDLTTISLKPVSGTAIGFLVIWSLLAGVVAIGGNIVIPMIADCADYEVYRSGQFVPGMLGTIFSFIDKIISSLSTAFIGFMVAIIGFKDALPTVDTPVSPELKFMGLLFFIGVPVIGWGASLIAMKFYDLDGDKMKEVQQAIHDRKESGEKPEFAE